MKNETTTTTPPNKPTRTYKKRKEDGIPKWLQGVFSVILNAILMALLEFLKRKFPQIENDLNEDLLKEFNTEYRQNGYAYYKQQQGNANV